MLLSILCTTLFVSAILWVILDKKYNWYTDLGAAIACVLLGILFLLNCICLAACPASTSADIRAFEAVRQTINEQRSDKQLSELERVQLTDRIIKQNEWLASEQFWASNKWLNWYYDKKILTIQPIK